MVRSGLLLALLFGLLVVASASAAPPAGVLADPVAAGPVAGTRDVVAWSGWDGAQFRLTTWRAGAVGVPSGVAGARLPFDVAAGTTTTGATVLLWPRCARPYADCDLVRFDPARPAEPERPVTGAARPDVEETAPALERGRLAYARSRSDHTAVSVVIRPLDVRGTVRTLHVGPRSFPANVVGPGTPAQRRVTHLWITGLALHGDTLAVAGRAGTQTWSPGVCGQAFVRLVSLRSGRERQVASGVCGMSGASYGPIAFDQRGRLWFVRTCNSDRSACMGDRGLPRRFDPRSGRTAVLTTDRVVTGLAASGSALVVNDQAARVPDTCLVIAADAAGVCDRLTVLDAAALPR